MTTLTEQVTGAYRWSARAKETGLARDGALLVARIGLAWLFIYHGASTLFGAFGGPGVHQASIFFGTVAHLHPATAWAVLGGIIEFFGGIAVGLGLFGRVAAAAIAGDMAMAMITVTWANGIASSRTGGGYELNLALCVLAVVVALLGTGRLSLDRVVASLLTRDRPPKVVAHGRAGHLTAP